MGVNNLFFNQPHPRISTVLLESLELSVSEPPVIALRTLALGLLLLRATGQENK